jgi:hypothetical protein
MKFDMRNFIVLAMLAMASPAWAETQCLYPTGCNPSISDGPAGMACTEPDTVLVGSRCMHKCEAGPNGNACRGWPTVSAQGGNMYSFHLDGQGNPTVWLVGPAGGGPALSSPKCDSGYALLAYPGTWTLVCARDLQEPR